MVNSASGGGGLAGISGRILKNEKVAKFPPKFECCHSKPQHKAKKYKNTII